MTLKSKMITKSLLLASFFVLTALSWCFQYYYTAWLIWFSYVPFLIVITDLKGSGAKIVFSTYAILLISCFCSFNWLLLLSKNQLLGGLAISIGAVAQSIPYIIFLLIWNKTKNQRAVWLLPFLVAIGEYLWWHLKITPPVPLAHTQAPLTFVSQYVDLFGNTAATFMIMLINVTVFRYWQLRKSFNFIAARIIFILTFPVCYSIGRVWQYHTQTLHYFKDGLSITLFRLDMPSDGEDLFQNSKEDFKRLERNVYLTDSISYFERQAKQPSDLYVWHEGAFNRRIPRLNKYVQNIILGNKVPVLTGINELDSLTNSPINGSMVFYPDGSMSSPYIKMNFVTYWENEYKRGNKYVMHSVKNKNNDSFNIATPICIEQFIPEHWAAFRKKGADIFIEICFETWFRNGFGVEPGLSNITALRCMENKVYGARTSNGGAAAFFNPVGISYQSTRSEEVLKGKIYKSNFSMTIYTRFPWIGITVVSMGFILFFINVINNPKVE